MLKTSKKIQSAFYAPKRAKNQSDYIVNALKTFKKLMKTLMDMKVKSKAF